MPDSFLLVCSHRSPHSIQQIVCSRHGILSAVYYVGSCDYTQVEKSLASETSLELALPILIIAVAPRVYLNFFIAKVHCIVVH